METSPTPPNKIEDNGLVKGLKSRHVTMLAVGGVIGAGFFLGAGATVNTAGPAVILSYLFGGLITFLVMVLLTEMAVSTPVAGSFQKYTQMSLGPLPGFLTGWTYWLAFLIGPASESIAAGTFLNVWFPQVPIWVFALAVAALMTAVNLIGVKFFGELEFWLSLVKVVALALFIIVGCIALFGITPVHSVSFSNLTSQGGFAPTGIAGIVTAMMIVMFSFGGTEAIGTAAEESEKPERDLPKALRSTLIRILVLFVLSIFVLVCILPWKKAGVSSSPFVDATNIIAGPVAANIMNFVVLIAALSCIDAGIYATSRMMFSMSRDGFFPKAFSKTSAKSKAPVNAILISCLMLFAGALLYYFFQDFAYTWLASVSGFGFLFAWLMICLSQPGMRKIALERDGDLKWKAPGGRPLQIIAVLLILAIYIGQLFSDSGRNTIIAGVIWLLIATAYYFAIGKKSYAKSTALQENALQ
ncbi:amino acid permease [Bifidobacterium subtile]|jgi:L-asparagine transporter-like permease|uniref:amino acid permease n=1 Tax=Bifidobacterium subtile TaxID=77635 RepID=UPI002F35C80B